MNVSGMPHEIDGPRAGPVPAAKRLIVKTLASRWLAPAWTPLTRDRVAFVTLHRFAEPDFGLFGHDPKLFRRVLERLRREGYALLSVDEAVRRLIERQGFDRPSVVFTMDDGYRGALDQCTDSFQAFDCPLTVFLTSGFIDGTCWFWWDQIEYVSLQSGRKSLDVSFDDRVIRLDLGSRRATILSLLQTFEWCKTLPDEQKWRFIRGLSDVAQVAIPDRPPTQYAPLTWSDARALESRGISFGPHTVTHPMLPQTSDAQAAREISESWARLRAELTQPLDVLSYPNGAYGEREVRILESLGLRGAVTTKPTYAVQATTGGVGSGRFTIPRFSYPDSPDPLFLIASGFEAMR